MLLPARGPQSGRYRSSTPHRCPRQQLRRRGGGAVREHGVVTYPRTRDRHARSSSARRPERRQRSTSSCRNSINSSSFADERGDGISRGASTSSGIALILIDEALPRVGFAGPRGRLCRADADVPLATDTGSPCTTSSCSRPSEGHRDPLDRPARAIAVRRSSRRHGGHGASAAGGGKQIRDEPNSFGPLGRRAGVSRSGSACCPGRALMPRDQCPMRPLHF